MTDTPLPEPVAWTWRDHTGCDHIDMDEQHALVTAAACGTIPTPLYASPPAPHAAVNPIGYLKPRAEWTMTPHFVYADEMAEDWQQQVFTIPVYASPPAPHVAEIPEWKTIESAPLDGREIIVGGCKYGASVRVVHWGAASFNRKTKSYDRGWTNGATWGFEPTHWMSLPAAPHHKQEGGNT